jgi:ABC-2 type transport system permease protein
VSAAEARDAGGADGAPHAGGAVRAEGSTFWIQISQLSRRSILRTLRQPAQVIPSITFPLILLAVNAGGLNAATKLPGFPTDSYLTFALGLCFIQGALFSAIQAGTELAKDVETGFLNRLSLTPLRGFALLVGLLSGVAVLGMISGATFLLVGLAAGAHLKAGVGGALVIVALAVVIALAFGCIGSFMALRTGSGEAVQGLFPLLFVLVFLSSTSLPRNLIEKDWFRTVATYNPVSYLVEAVRAPLIYGWRMDTIAYGFITGLAMFAVFLALSTSALRTRLTRT